MGTDADDLDDRGSSGIGRMETRVEGVVRMMRGRSHGCGCCGSCGGGGSCGEGVQERFAAKLIP